MQTRRLGKTGLQVSEIGFGAEWLERHPEEEGVELIHYAADAGINILDCWMPDPKSRDIIGLGIRDDRVHWYIQGHLGSTWKNGQYYRTRDLVYVRPAFEDLLTRLQTDYIDLGMIHYVDSEEEWEQILHSDYLSYVMELKKTGVIHHIGLSSHNPKVAVKAAESGFVEMILFSVNPAFDMLPASEDIDTMFAERFDAGLKGIDAARAHLYSVCEQNDVGITVMKGFAGGRLFDEKRSPFGVCLTPVQCIHYALTRPAVCSILCGYDTKGAGRRGRRLRDRVGRGKGLRVGAGQRAVPLLPRPVHLLRALQAVRRGAGYRDDQQILRSCDHAARGPGDHPVALRAAGAYGLRMHRLPCVRSALSVRRADRPAYGAGRRSVRPLNPALRADLRLI